MCVRRLDAVSGLDAIAEGWDELQANSRQRNVFLTWEWLSAWWRFGGHGSWLYLLAVEDNRGELVGLAPFMIRENKWLGVVPIREIVFLGTGPTCSDHLDFLSRAGLEENVAVSISDYLCNHQSDWDLIHLNDIPANSVTLKILRSCFGRDHIWTEAMDTLCPYFPITSSWDAFLQTLRGKFRKKLRYERRVFEYKLNGRFAVCRTQSEVAHAMARLSELNPVRWEQQGASSAFADRAFMLFHQEIATTFFAKGWLELAYLQIAGNIAAVLYAFKYGNKIFYYNSAFDSQWAKYSLGSVLLGYCVEKAFKEDLEEFDFLRGPSSCKDDWTSLARRNRNIMIVKRSKKGLLWHQAHAGLAFAKEKGRRYLPTPIRQILKHALSRVR